MKATIWFEKHLANIPGVTDFKPMIGTYYDHCGEFTYHAVVFKLDSRYSATTEITPIVSILDKYGRDIDYLFYNIDTYFRRSSLSFEFKISKHFAIQAQLNKFVESTLEHIELVKEFCEKINKRLTRHRELYEKVYAMLLPNQPIPDKVPSLNNDALVIEELEGAVVKVYLDTVDVSFNRRYAADNIENLERIKALF